MKKGLSSKPFGFFVEENDSANNLQPLYLLCTKEPDNQLFFFITSSNSHCWVKQANSWERLEIKNLLFARDGGSRTYCFKDNHYHIDRLDIPYPFRNNAQYTSLIYGHFFYREFHLRQRQSERVDWQKIILQQRLHSFPLHHK